MAPGSRDGARTASRKGSRAATATTKTSALECRGWDRRPGANGYASLQVRHVPTAVCLCIPPSIIHLSVGQSVHPFICHPHPSVYTSSYYHPFSMHPFFHPSTLPSIVNPFIHPFIIYLSTHPSILPPIHLSIHPPIHPSFIRPSSCYHSSELPCIILHLSIYPSIHPPSILPSILHSAIINLSVHASIRSSLHQSFFHSL